MNFSTEQPDPLYRNEVVLVGRVSMPATRRSLPSGGVLLGVRVIVERNSRPEQRPAVRVDAIDCVAWPERCQKTVESLRSGDLVEVTGALRRRFRRTDAGPVSRYEVEIESIRLVAPAARKEQPPASAEAGPPDCAT